MQSRFWKKIVPKNFMLNSSRKITVFNVNLPLKHIYTRENMSEININKKVNK